MFVKSCQTLVQAFIVGVTALSQQFNSGRVTLFKKKKKMEELSQHVRLHKIISEILIKQKTNHRTY